MKPLKLLAAALMAVLLVNSTVFAYYILEGTNRRLESYGREVPLNDALQMILSSSPSNNWQVIFKKRTPQKKVSWGKESCWEEAIISVAEQAQSEVLFDYQNKKLFISPAGSRNSTLALENKVWKLSVGSLQKQLTQWARQAGYKLIWNSKHDYQIQAPGRINGDFMTSIQTLFNSLHSSGTPLRASIYKNNKVLAVQED